MDIFCTSIDLLGWKRAILTLNEPCMLCPDLRSCHSGQVAEGVMPHRWLFSYCDMSELFSDACGATALLLGALQRRD